MSSLAVFPPEVLEWITGVINTSDQIRLWLCGDSNLNIKLANGGLKKTSLQWTSSGWLPWPKLFFLLFSGLKVVEWDCAYGSSLCPALDINLLPKNLERLYLRFDDVFRLLRAPQVRLNTMLPLLQKLQLEGKQLSEENLQHLPETLLHLQVICTRATIESGTLFQNLPRSIEYLHLAFNVKDLKEHGNDFPRNLDTLIVVSVEASFNWLLKLPKTLKFLFANGGQKWNTLPPHLERLTLLRGAADKLQNLPTKLTSFACLSDLAFTDQMVASLPKSLTDLRFSNSEATHFTLQQLPPTLTNLNVSIRTTHPEILSFYSPNATAITLEEGPCSSQLKLSSLPPKLSTLNIHHLDDELCLLLPNTLTMLKANTGFITAKGACKLPKSLRLVSLTLGMFDDSSTMSYLGFVPRLVFGGRTDAKRPLASDWISYLVPSNPIQPYEPQYASHRLYMTPSLKMFCYGHMPHDYITEESLSYLPQLRHLRVLEVGSQPKFLKSDCLRFVPENVVELKFGTFFDFPSLDVLKTLPQGLQFLQLTVSSLIGTCPWKDEDFLHFPRTLKSLDLICDECAFPNLTEHLNQFTPPYLMELKSSYRDFPLFKTPLAHFYDSVQDAGAGAGAGNNTGSGLDDSAGAGSTGTTTVKEPSRHRKPSCSSESSIVDSDSSSDHLGYKSIEKIDPSEPVAGQLDDLPGPSFPTQPKRKGNTKKCTIS